MTLRVQDNIPTNHAFQYLDPKTKEPAELPVSKLQKGTWVLVGVPAAFSPPCSEQHLPSYVDQLSSFQAKGARVLVISIDNLFAQRAWAKSFGVEGEPEKILFVSDPELKFVKESGLSTTEVAPLGEVSSRFALVVKDGKVSYVGQEKTVGEVTVSSAETVLKQL